MKLKEYKLWDPAYNFVVIARYVQFDKDALCSQHVKVSKAFKEVKVERLVQKWENIDCEWNCK